MYLYEHILRELPVKLTWLDLFLLLLLAYFNAISLTTKWTWFSEEKIMKSGVPIYYMIFCFLIDESLTNIIIDVLQLLFLLFQDASSTTLHVPKLSKDQSDPPSALIATKEVNSSQKEDQNRLALKAPPPFDEMNKALIR